MKLDVRAVYIPDLEKGNYIPFYLVESPGVVRFEDKPEEEYSMFQGKKITLPKHPFTYDISNVLVDPNWEIDRFAGVPACNGTKLYENDRVINMETDEVGFIQFVNGVFCLNVFGGLAPIFNVCHKLAIRGRWTEDDDIYD